MALRTASRVDANQALIVHQLKNCFDILVGYRGRTHIMEIKDPAQPESKRQLTPGEAKFRAEWKGTPYHVVETVDQALKIITNMLVITTMLVMITIKTITA